MKYKICLFVLLLIGSLPYNHCYSQRNLENYLGGWCGQIEDLSVFSFQVSLYNQNESYALELLNKSDRTILLLNENENGLWEGQQEDQLKVMLDISTSEPFGYFIIGHHWCCVSFIKNTVSGKWETNWNLLLDTAIDPSIYLSLDQRGESLFQASTFMQSPVPHYMNGYKLKWDQRQIFFQDSFSRIQFTGDLLDNTISLHLEFLGFETKALMHRKDYDQWLIGVPDEPLNKLWYNNKDYDKLKKLTKHILSDSLERTHAVIVSKEDEVIYEQYFDGFNRDIPHDTRSLSKSFASAMVGICIKEGLLEGERIYIKPFYEQAYPDINWSDGKDQITIEHLLTMSSGLDVIDFGLNRTSYGNEGRYQSQENWTKYILNAPMINKPGSHANYGSGNPQLIGPILSSLIKEPLAFYIHKKLFLPMGITNYRFQTDRRGNIYFGGGWYFCPRDLVKFGQLFLNGGRWNGVQLMSSAWCEKSFKKHKTLENANDKNLYGYLFWHKTYFVEDKPIHSIEARGSGGQYLFIVPSEKIVTVITSGNFNNGKAFQPERIFQDYILSQLKAN